MHDIKSIRDNPAAFDAALKRRVLAPLLRTLPAAASSRLASSIEAKAA